MNNRRFKLSRVEVFLGLAVLLGLFYILYAYGLGGRDTDGQINHGFTQAAQDSVKTIIARQAEINEVVRRIEERLEELSAQPDSPQLSRLRKDLTRLSESLNMLDIRLGEISRLLPKEQKTD